ncbi:MAG: methylamine utilization protein MauE [Gammaproteobacteria bacterium]|nr:methylamine utilization protein MauE [Gammaproteobacteria bacterium]MDH5310379.1 methylamine utilization protein MauE [Gammaproteobacteria bacterium]
MIERAIALAFALLLGTAAWHKAAGGAAFRDTLQDYRLLPDRLLAPMQRAIPLGEAALAIGWLAGVPQRPVALATAGLMGIYGLAIAINLLRGRVHIGCGCGLGAGSRNDQPISWWLVLRNTVLVAAALLPLLPANGRVLGGLDWATLAAALLASALLYAGAGQLFANRAAIRSWRHSRG